MIISVDAEKSLFFDEENTQQTRMEENIINVIYEKLSIKKLLPGI